MTDINIVGAGLAPVRTTPIITRGCIKKANIIVIARDDREAGIRAKHGACGADATNLMMSKTQIASSYFLAMTRFGTFK